MNKNLYIENIFKKILYYIPTSEYSSMLSNIYNRPKYACVSPFKGARKGARKARKKGAQKKARKIIINKFKKIAVKKLLYDVIVFAHILILEKGSM